MKLTNAITRSLGLAFVFFLVGATHAQTPTINLTAKSANVANSGTPVKISILHWSTDEERKPVAEAMDPVAQAAAQASAAAGGRGGGAGRGGRGGRGGGGGGLDPNDPAQADLDAQPARGGRGGRGGGRGDAAAAPPKPPDPTSVLASAISKAPTVGYLWTNETVGYSIKYAHRIAMPDGGERIILATDRRLGGGTAGWKLSSTGTPTDYAFTLIEIRMDSKGLGEGKASLTSKVIFDKDAKSPVLENYAATPAILQSVKR